MRHQIVTVTLLAAPLLILMSPIARAWEYREGIEEYVAVVPQAMLVNRRKDVFVAMHEYDPQYTDHQSLKVLKLDGDTGHALWTAGTAGTGQAGWGGRPSSMEIDARGDVIIAGRTGSPNVSYPLVVKLDGGTGRLLWSARVTASEPQYSGWAVLGGLDHQGNAYAALWWTYERAVAKLSGREGAVLWTRTDLPELRSLAFGRQTVAVMQWRDRVDALDAASGERRWAVDVPGVYNVEVDRRGAVVFQGWDGRCTLGKLAAADGVPVWVHHSGCGYASFALDEGTGDVTAATIEDDQPATVRRIHRDDGRVRWATSIAHLASINGVALTPDGDVLVLGSAQNREDLEIVRLSGIDGGVAWRIRIDGPRLFGFHLVGDRRGDVIGATVYSPGGGEALMRILKRYGRTGEDYGVYPGISDTSDSHRRH